MLPLIFARSDIPVSCLLRHFPRGTSDYAPEMVHAAVRGEKASCFVPPHAQLLMTMPEAAEATLAWLLLRGLVCSKCTQSRRPTVAELEMHFEIGSQTWGGLRPHPFRSEIVDSWPADVDDSAAQRDWFRD